MKVWFGMYCRASRAMLCIQFLSSDIQAMALAGDVIHRCFRQASPRKRRQELPDEGKLDNGEEWSLHPEAAPPPSGSTTTDNCSQAGKVITLAGAHLGASKEISLS